MKNFSIEWFVINAFLESARIPWEQGALLYRINTKRQLLGYGLIDNKSFGRHLSRLKSKGKVRRLRWFNPSERNIWELSD